MRKVLGGKVGGGREWGKGGRGREVGEGIRDVGKWRWVNGGGGREWGKGGRGRAVGEREVGFQTVYNEIAYLALVVFLEVVDVIPVFFKGCFDTVSAIVLMINHGCVIDNLTVLLFIV